MGNLKRNGDEIRDALEVAGRQVKDGLRQRQRDQGGGIRDRNRRVEDKDAELDAGTPGSANGSGRGPVDGQVSDHGGTAARPDPVDTLAHQIANGHAYDKHVTNRREFDGDPSRGQFAAIIADVVRNGQHRPLSDVRDAYWLDGTIVIRNLIDPDGGTAFRPTGGIAYFLDHDL